MAARRLPWLTLALAAGCYAHTGNSYYPSRYEGGGGEFCDYYGPYGPRSSYYYAPGTDLGYPQGPNDHYFYGGGLALGYGGGPLYGPMPPGYCPRDKK
ncbi:MAG: hypothetical protein ACXWP4_11805 [Polyangiales bacterium]